MQNLRQNGLSELEMDHLHGIPSLIDHNHSIMLLEDICFHADHALKKEKFIQETRY